MKARTNDEWVADLRSAPPDAALVELRAILLRSLNGATVRKATWRPPI